MISTTVYLLLQERLAGANTAQADSKCKSDAALIQLIDLVLHF